MDEKGMLMAVDGTTTPPAKEDGVWRKNAEVEDSMVTNRLYAGAHSQASAIIAWDSPYIGYEKKGASQLMKEEKIFTDIVEIINHT